jgi:hypothetical protein
MAEQYQELLALSKRLPSTIASATQQSKRGWTDAVPYGFAESRPFAKILKDDRATIQAISGEFMRAYLFGQMSAPVAVQDLIAVPRPVQERAV